MLHSEASLLVDTWSVSTIDDADEIDSAVRAALVGVEWDGAIIRHGRRPNNCADSRADRDGTDRHDTDCDGTNCDGTNYSRRIFRGRSCPSPDRV